MVVVIETIILENADMMEVTVYENDDFYNSYIIVFISRTNTRLLILKPFYKSQY